MAAVQNVTEMVRLPVKRVVLLKPDPIEVRIMEMQITREIITLSNPNLRGQNGIPHLPHNNLHQLEVTIQEAMILSPVHQERAGVNTAI